MMTALVLAMAFGIGGYLVGRVRTACDSYDEGYLDGARDARAG